MEKRRVLMTHYDLDGVAAYILADKLFHPIEKKISCGYGKVIDKVNDGSLKGFDSCIVTDLSLTPEQFEDISAEYADRFLYVDHHPSTYEALLSYNNGSVVEFSVNFSATGLMFQRFQKYLRGKDVGKFVQSVDAYDMWRHKTHPDQFSDGYDLNILFWKYGFDDFADRFSNDMSLVYNEFEKKTISDHKKERDEVISRSDITKFGTNSVLILDAPKDYINDYTIQLPEYDVFFIVYISSEDKMRLSVRTTLEDVDTGAIIKRVMRHFPEIISGGGHPKTSGADFIEDVSLDTVIDVVEYINNEIEDEYRDIPF